LAAQFQRASLLVFDRNLVDADNIEQAGTSISRNQQKFCYIIYQGTLRLREVQNTSTNNSKDNNGDFNYFRIILSTTSSNDSIFLNCSCQVQ